MTDLESRMDKAKKFLGIVRDIVFYMPIDGFTIPIRNRVIPRFVKREFPSIACRGYALRYENGVTCKPAKRYTTRKMFSYVCRHYDMKTGGCNRYAKPKDL